MPTSVGRLGGAAALVLVGLAVILGLSAVVGGPTSGAPRGWLVAGCVTALLGALVVLLLLRQERLSREAAARLLAQETSTRKFESLLRDSTDLLLVTGPDGNVVYCSPASQRVLGLAPEAVVGRPVNDLVQSADWPMVLEGLERLAGTENAELTLELRVRHANGSRRILESRVRNPGADAGVPGLVWSARDITERRALEQELNQRVMHDGLTRVPNRALLLERLGRALGRAERHRSVVAVVLVCLDDLAMVNETLGHAAGDEVVIAAAARLEAAVRAEDTVARLGGGEFALLLEEAADLGTVVSVTERSLALLAEPIEAAGRALLLTATAGVALNGTANAFDGPEGMLRDAQAAANVARGAGKSRYLVFEESMREHAEDRSDLTADIRAATHAGQIKVLYQPLIDLQTGELEGFEALARWQHPGRGLVLPSTFIPVAEDSGAIHDIGRYVLETACRQAAAWNAEAPGMRMSVNVSPFQLAGDDILVQVREVLTATGLPAHQLILEMTESALVHDLTSVTRRLQGLRVMGARIAMDDFGTGYSSLAYLRRLPLDIVKIDKSFIDDERGAGPELLSSVIAMGTTLGLDTVAEGIEDPEQLERARLAGCTYGQGYLIARPMDAADATHFMAEHARHLAAYPA
jgi:diguanylate cyclase (GGDEF)-like protein/PAS domain S-box-containing protein